MRTVTYKSVLDGVFHRDGVTPDDAPTAERTAAIEYIADRFRTAWEYYRWPELIKLEARRYRDTWSATSYAAGAEIWHADTETYYQAATSATASDIPGTASLWTEITEFYRYIAYGQTGQTAIEAALSAYDKDPRVHADAQRLGFKVRPEGIAFDPGAPDVVYLEYRPLATDFGGTLYSATASYAEGDRVYHAPSMYRVLSAASPGESPDTAPAKYEALEFPYILARAVKYGAYADLLAASGQHDKAAAWEGRFSAELDEQVFQLTTLQGQTGRYTQIPVS
jgi:hypothetical protein